MNNSKHGRTRTVVFVSLLTLLLVVAMLAGATLAWFTARITSASNHLEAGDLTVKLTHTNSAVTDEEVTSETKLFNLTKWEPGAMAVETFTVTNIGDVAFDFTFTFADVIYNTIKDAEGNLTNKNVFDRLRIAVVEEVPATREDFLAMEPELLPYNMIEKTGRVDLSEAHNSATFTVVICWIPSEFGPNNIDDDYNISKDAALTRTSDGKKLWAEFYISLYALQVSTVQTATPSETTNP